jgi:hypothetical protein
MFFNIIKDLIIQDQKRTIERLQEELRDKSNFIFNLMTLIENNEVYGMATKQESEE